MTYELAKKLKDSGFPQNPYHKDGTPSIILNSINGDEDGIINFSECLEPTLSELIEECGDGFGLLFKFGNVWKASDKYGEDVFNCIEGISYGETPEEAVAHLYLELHKNEN